MIITAREGQSIPILQTSVMEVCTGRWVNICFSPSFASITLVRRKQIEGALPPAHCKGNKFTTCTDPLQGPLQLMGVMPHKILIHGVLQLMGAMLCADPSLQLMGVLPRKSLLHGVLQLMGWTETVRVPLTAANQLFYVLCAT